VSGALRGEVCRILILKVLKSAAFAKVLEVLAPSPHRIAPDCPYFPRCGGCTYRHMDYGEELALKRRRVQDNLARIGGSEVEVEDAVLTAVETRSSSPVRIVRDNTYQTALRGLYPCGEGAGYAGGILSAAADGMRCAEQIIKEITQHG